MKVLASSALFESCLPGVETVVFWPSLHMADTELLPVLLLVRAQTHHVGPSLLLSLKDNNPSKVSSTNMETGVPPFEFRGYNSIHSPVFHLAHICRCLPHVCTGLGARVVTAGVRCGL